jgi:phosphoglycerate dehydrogenase-like enzyme
VHRNASASLPEPPTAPASRRPADRIGEPLVVAAPAWAAPTLERLGRAGELGLSVEHVVVDENADVVSGEPGRAEVLWRHGRLASSWVATAVDRLPNLAWVHSDFVGVDGVPLQLLARRGVALTNGAGNFSRPMAEYVVLAMLAAAKRFTETLRHSAAGEWRPPGTLDELDGAVALLVGLGSVNTIVAALLQPFGTRVLATSRTRPEPLPPGVAAWYGQEEWRGVLGEVDYLVLGVPHTPATHHLLDASTLGALKRGAYVVNVARGALVDDSALLEAIEAGQVSGALLDAFETEPLSGDHPYWRRQDVVVVPHHTWSSPRVPERMTGLFERLATRWASGGALENLVDLEAGY